MKKIFMVILACLMLVGCTNPAQETAAPEKISELDKVPEMGVSCGSDTFSVTSENYSWTSPGPDGEMFAVVACGHHPLERYITQEFRGVTDDLITLSFPVEPDSIVVLRWAKDAGVKEMDRGESVPLDGLSFVMEDGSWVYQITASWNRDTWSGEAEYQLYLTR